MSSNKKDIMKTIKNAPTKSKVYAGLCGAAVVVGILYYIFAVIL